MISTHVLDTSKGMPAGSVSIELRVKRDNVWVIVQTGITNPEGRFSFSCEIGAGDYQICFLTENYFLSQKLECFFLNTVVSFRVSDLKRNYHVPLLLNPYGYSTYRGS